ncbi:SEC-C domain-containing protein [Mariprofundus ferrooxydans]|nr:SEC-C domain-containing protein [Mariprofundus ferrooxydans]
MLNDFNEPPAEFYDAFMGMLHESVGLLINVEPDAQQFIETYTRLAMTDYFDIFDYMDSGSENEKRSLARMFAIQIWNNTPLPSNRYQFKPLAKPGRNDPCFCGSGKKYKQCCVHLDTEDMSMMQPDLMTYILLEVITKTELKQVWKHLPHSQLAFIAGEWMKIDEEQAERGLLMLDPIFKQADSKLDYRDEEAFDSMAELCTVLQKPRKKSILVKRMMQHPDKALQAAALHRYCCILGDQGKDDEAWGYFKKAQRLDPNNPALSHLEILLLMQQGKIEQMQQRGRYWIKRLARMNKEGELDDLIDVINEMITDAPTAMGKLIEHDTPGAARLIAWLKTASQSPPPLLNKVQAYDDSSVIEPKTNRAAILERDWMDVMMGYDDPWENPDRWLQELEEHPELAGSSNVLDDLIQFVRVLDTPNPMLTFEPLLMLAMFQIKRLLPQQPKVPFDWGFMQNRPALRVLGFLIDSMVQMDDHQAALDLMEWSVRLHPNDNQGFRSDLVNAYLRLNRDADALTLCDQYPEDFLVDICFGRTLALFRQGKRQLADTHLKKVIRQFPKVAAAITRTTMKQPKDLDPGLVACGGDDEAWYYRQDARELWVNTPGAMTWLKQCLKTVAP